MAFVLTCTLAIAASAQDRDDQNRDQNHQMQNQDRDHADNGAWSNRAGYDYRTYERDQHPDGWQQGSRADAKNCEGHDGCYTYQFQGEPYYWYRGDNGRMVVLRRHREDRDDHHDQH